MMDGMKLMHNGLTAFNAGFAAFVKLQSQGLETQNVPIPVVQRNDPINGR